MEFVAWYFVGTVLAGVLILAGRQLVSFIEKRKAFDVGPPNPRPKPSPFSEVIGKSQ